MSVQEHIVRRQVFEIRMPNHICYLALQNQINFILKESVFPKLGTICDFYSLPGIYYSINQLEIDLGYISLLNLQSILTEEIPKQFEIRLLEFLKSKMSSSTSSAELNRINSNMKQKPDNILLSTSVKPEISVEIITHFLNDGTLPWWYQHNKRTLISMLLELGMKGNLTNLKETIASLSKVSLVRFIHQQTDQQLLKIIKILNLNLYPIVLVLHHDFLHLFPHIRLFRCLSTSRLRHYYWLFVISFVLNQGKYKDITHLVGGLIEYMAFAYSVSDIYLLGELLKCKKNMIKNGVQLHISRSVWLKLNIKHQVSKNFFVLNRRIDILTNKINSPEKHRQIKDLSTVMLNSNKINSVQKILNKHSKKILLDLLLEYPYQLSSLSIRLVKILKRELRHIIEQYKDLSDEFLLKNKLLKVNRDSNIGKLLLQAKQFSYRIQKVKGSLKPCLKIVGPIKNTELKIIFNNFQNMLNELQMNVDSLNKTLEQQYLKKSSKLKDINRGEHINHKIITLHIILNYLKKAIRFFSTKIPAKAKLTTSNLRDISKRSDFKSPMKMDTQPFQEIFRKDNFELDTIYLLTQIKKATYKMLNIILHRKFMNYQKQIRLLESNFSSLKDHHKKITSFVDRHILRENAFEVRLINTPLAEGVYVENAGLVLYWVYLKTLFEGLAFLNQRKNAFINKSKNIRAALLLNVLVQGDFEPAPEYELTLNKLLCGIRLEEPLPYELRFNAKEKKECQSIIFAILTHWTALGKITSDRFMQAFVQRQGIIKFHDNHWVLQVEKKPQDILLNRLPWSIQAIKLPWMPQHLIVEW